MSYSFSLVVIACFSAALAIGQKTMAGEALLSSKPVLFQENKGQIIDVKGKVVPYVLFKASAPGTDTYITTDGLVYVFSTCTDKNASAVIGSFSANQLNPERTLEMEWLQVHLEGATILSENVVKEHSGKADYRFFLPHCPNGITTKEYEKITVKEVYPGIDWVLCGSSKTGMKYDFIVHPGADPSQIKLRYEGQRPLEMDEEGNIQVQMRFGKLTENAPISFWGDNHKEPVQSAFKSEIIDQHNVVVMYAIGAYDKQQTLTIDPQLTWGTRFGGNSGELLASITHDSNNNVFITGATASADFPELDAGTYYQSSSTVVPDSPFILKFDNNGVLLWATIYGTGGTAFSITCDANDNVFVTGEVQFPNFPVQDGGTYFDATFAGATDLFILKFDNSGNRLWASYYGGAAFDRPHSLVCDAAGNVFITGYTTSADFPLQNSGTYFQTYTTGGGDAFMLKFDNVGNRLWATCYGGSGNDDGHSINCDANGNVFVTGETASANLPLQDAGSYFDGINAATDGFILKFDNNGNRLWATYYGGSGNDQGEAIAVDATGNVFVHGYTESINLPVQNAGTYFDGSFGGINDRFMLKFDNAGNRLWATYYGGSEKETQFLSATRTTDNLSLDECGNIYISFTPTSTDIQTIDPGGSYYDSNYGGGLTDLYLACFTNDGTLTWGTYVGGPEYDGFQESIETDGNNNLFAIGLWDANSADLLVDPGNGAYFDTTHNTSSSTSIDGFILKFIPDQPSYTTGQTSAGCDCSGTASVNVVGGTPPYTYTWSNGAQTSNVLITTDTAQNLCAGSYWVEISTCISTDTVFFTILAATPPVVIFAATDTTICAGYCTTFTANAIPGATYAWSFGDGSTSVQQNPIHCYTTSGNYDVSLTITNGSCSGTQTIGNYIEVYASPVAGINADPQVTTISSPTVNFVSQSSGEIAWHWNFGDAFPGQSDASAVTYTYNEVGDYLVSLIVRNQFDCADTAFTTITVFDDFVFYAPNTFTPDGDGINDVWSFHGTGIDVKKYKLNIFNRWGELIWQTSELTESWNGTVNGKPVPEGVYTWTVRIASQQQRVPVLYNGSVTLIR